MTTWLHAARGDLFCYTVGVRVHGARWRCPGRAGLDERDDGNADGRRADAAYVKLIPTTPLAAAAAAVAAPAAAANCGPSTVSRRRRSPGS